jgi:hypothetical protein
MRIAMAWLAISAMSSSAFAQDFKSSIDKAVAQQQSAAQHQSAAQRSTQSTSGSTKSSRVLGASLLVGGAICASIGFLKTTSFEKWAPSHTALGVAGLGAVIGGGLILVNSQQPSGDSSSAMVRPGVGFGVAKRVSW